MSLTGQATIGRKEKTCGILKKNSTEWSNYRKFYRILGGLQYRIQYGTARNLGT